MSGTKRCKYYLFGYYYSPGLFRVKPLLSAIISERHKCVCLYLKLCSGVVQCGYNTAKATGEHGKTQRGMSIFGRVCHGREKQKR